jgi:threonine/homoserine/homoserine lactone efflux protein
MLETVAAFALTSLVIELTPGPNMGYLAVLSLDRGRSAGLAAVGGVALGLALLGIVAGLGAGTVISETRWIYEALRWAGVGYLLWLALDSYREAQKPAEGGEPTLRGLAGYFRRGLITNLLNPKAALFYVTVLPNFVDPTRPVLQQSALLTAIYVAVATAVHAALVVAAGTLQPVLASSRMRKGAGIAAAILLVGIAIWLAFATRRSW